MNRAASHEPWLSIEAHPRGVVRVVRHHVPFASLAELERAYGGVVEALDALPRARRALLVDLRAAPSRNDPAFERTIAPLRKRMWEGFARRGVLLRSAVGKLQIERHAAQDGVSVSAFHELDDALRALAVDDEPAP